MALLPKKTYSRRNNELSVLSDKEKENVDPFDELLSSPLKQEVQFQPLSFWGQKIRRLESKHFSKKADCGLFKASDSDEANSPCQRKRKPKSKKSESKARTLPPKNRSRTLIDRRKNFSTGYFSVDKTKAHKSIISNNNESVLHTQEIRKYEGWSPNSTLYPNESMETTLKLSCKNCDTFDCINLNRDFCKIDPATPLYSVRAERNYTKKLNDSLDKDFKVNNLRFKIYEDGSTSGQKLDEDLIFKSKEDSGSSTIHSDKSLDETLMPFELGRDSFKFVSVRRHFNYPDCVNMLDGSFSDPFKTNSGSSIQLWNKSNKSINSAVNLKFEDISMPSGFLGENHDETLISNSSINITSCYNKSMDKTLCNVDSTPLLSEESTGISTLQCQNENTLSDVLYFMSFNDTELEDIIQELFNANAMDGVILESSSDDTLSSFLDEETVINLKLKPETKDSPLTDSAMRKDITHLVSSGVSVLTTSMSELSVKTAFDGGLPESEIDKTGNVPQDSNFEDKEKSTFSVDLRNVTTKRRGVLNKRYERKLLDRPSCVIGQESQKEKETDSEMEWDQSLWMPGRASLDWNKSISFVNPVFESTRVFDMGSPDRKRQTNRFTNNESILEETLCGCDKSYALKPGKKWLRSRSVLKQLQNGTILESTRITGRKFKSFVQEMMELQNEKSGFFNSIADVAVSNKTVMSGSGKNNALPHLKANKTVLEREGLFEKLNDSVFSKNGPNETILEKSSLSHTVKVIQAEEKASAFRNALGLQSSRLLSEEDSIQEESSDISARDFILIQCGQEDVLPFEEYFNERTLDNCRKIGEGVYGEVFMCSDAVIKIIPIEGADKVNGEPQKTFAEIISEVVIASKLSNLRNGKKHRTDGFSEMKRCWCVKGKYPKYLLQLWDDYDQQGSGSENDSPIMFKEDQLYIILELANGGKDLESFVFSSSAQSLSVFIQTAFSLAAAEKAFEFEHRDLHWGNVLISETKDKFMTVYLDGVEYKIPTKGVKVCIIDFTLSRINHEGCCIFNDLSVDPTLFASEGDYQFEIYRLMLNEVKNDWSLFRPKTNIFWLHYTLDKMLKMVRYKNKKAKIHTKHLKDLKTLECVVLDHEDSTDFVLGNTLSDVMNKL